MRYHSALWMQRLVHPLFSFGMPLAWVVLVYMLWLYMTVHSAPNVKVYMRIYNFIQIVLCLYMFYGLLPCIGFPNIFGINSAFDERGEWFVFVHFLSKFLDWFDTLWIVLKRNREQLSFLHVFHHASIPMVWGYLLHCDVGSGTCRYGACVNSLTHVVMYAHYLWTSFGMKNPFKKYVFWLQMLQFYSCLAHAFLVWFLERTEIREYAWIQVGYQVTMVYLFTQMLHWVPSCIPKPVNLASANASGYQKSSNGHPPSTKGSKES